MQLEVTSAANFNKNLHFNANFSCKLKYLHEFNFVVRISFITKNRILAS